MKVIGLILARGGSVNLLGKNLAIVGGQTLLERGIKTLAAVTPTVVVSTDDPDIETEAIRCGAYVVRRPPALSTADSVAQDAMRHALTWLDFPDVIVNPMITHPMITVNDTVRTLDRYMSGDCDISLLVRYNGNVFLDDNGNHLNYDVNGSSNRQQRSKTFEHAGLVVFPPKHLEGLWLDGRIGLVEADHDTIDIHTALDLEHANLAIRWLQSERAAANTESTTLVDA